MDMFKKALHNFSLSVLIEHNNIKKNFQHSQLKCNVSTMIMNQNAVFIPLLVLDYVTVFSVEGTKTIKFRLKTPFAHHTVILPLDYLTEK